MKLLETNCKYTYKYEIESNYKIGDEIIFTEKSKLDCYNGTIVGIVTFQNYNEYVVSYRPRIRGGMGECVLGELPITNSIFTEEQIALKMEI